MVTRRSYERGRRRIRRERRAEKTGRGVTLRAQDEGDRKEIATVGDKS